MITQLNRSQMNAICILSALAVGLAACAESPQVPPIVPLTTAHPGTVAP